MLLQWVGPRRLLVVSIQAQRLSQKMQPPRQTGLKAGPEGGSPMLRKPKRQAALTELRKGRIRAAATLAKLAVRMQEGGVLSRCRPAAVRP